MDNLPILRNRSNSIPQQGRMIGFTPQLDSSQDRVVDKLDFEAIKALIDAAKDGDAEAQIALNAEMEARDAHLKQVAWVRRASLTGMAWDIDPVDSTADESSAALAEEAADFIRAECERVPSFDRILLRSMAKAIGPNLAGIEVEWMGSRVRRFHRVYAQRLVIDWQRGPEVLIRTQHNQNGMLPAFAKFVFHTPDDSGSSGNPFENTITRAQAPIWAIKKFAQQDWATFAEVFGMPVRVAKYGKTATAADKSAANAALAAMGSKAYMLLSEDMQYEIKEIARGTEPYSTMMEYLKREQAIGYLGQNLTTDTTGSGGLGGAGAAAVHQDTKRLITEEDARAEDCTLRETIFSWMLRYRYPKRWQLMPIPHLRRIWREPDESGLDKAEKIRKASQEIGLPVPQGWALRQLNVPDASDGEAIIKRIKPVALPGGSIGF